MAQWLACWIPAAFCGLLVLLTVIRPDPPGTLIPFVCFLPMCFFFEGLLTSRLRRDVRDLRKQVEELKQKHAQESH